MITNTHLLFIPVPARDVASIRPDDKNGQIWASLMNGPEWRDAIEAGFIKQGELLNKSLIRKSEFTPAGTHDGIRDAESNFAQWGWAIWRDA